MSDDSIDYSIYYERFHNDSDEHAQQMVAILRPMIEQHCPKDRAANVLDVGCGYGFALRALQSLGFADVQGVELSRQQADRCRAAGLRVDCAEDPIAWLEARPGSFEFVLLLDVIEHVPVKDQIRFLRAIHRCLNPGGRLLVTTPNANAILSARWRYNDYTHHSSFTEHSLNFVLKNAGFDGISIDGSKGLGRFPRRLWSSSAWPGVRKWLVRWCWLQVFKAELPWERLDEISFELNMTAVAERS